VHAGTLRRGGIERAVALKALRLAAAGSTPGQQAALSGVGAALAAAAGCDRLVPLLGATLVRGRPALLMPRYASSLAARLPTAHPGGGGAPPPVALAIAEALCQGLVAIHAGGAAARAAAATAAASATRAADAAAAANGGITGQLTPPPPPTTPRLVSVRQAATMVT